jgi:FtsP/CotA-like multicopper oxidase with cupredoxin domain
MCASRTSRRCSIRCTCTATLPSTTVDVDFDADNPDQWLTHCHYVYHGEAGMMTVVSYKE